VQDKWRVNNKLTMSLGVRYDLEIIPIAEYDDPLVTEYPTTRTTSSRASA
jgi:hypothetical protein